MITEILEIRCDECGKVETFTNVVNYRISSLLSKAFKMLTLDGWKFERDENHKLVSVICKKCVEDMQVRDE